MKCPHCLIAFHPSPNRFELGEDADGHWAVVQHTCPECHRQVLYLHRLLKVETPRGPKIAPGAGDLRLVHPRSASRGPCPPAVPVNLAEDYSEACLVLSDSPKASAALSRRCLQHLLREHAKVRPSELANEIQEILDRKTLPPYLAEAIDGVRNIGNFAAHPMKSKSSGEILPVETGEAEWNLELLEAMFEFYFVQPADLTKRRDALNKKLAEAGKPPMK